MISHHCPIISHTRPGKQTVCYWKWPSWNSWFILAIENGPVEIVNLSSYIAWWFSIVFCRFTRGYFPNSSIFHRDVRWPGGLHGRAVPADHGRSALLLQLQALTATDFQIDIVIPCTKNRVQWLYCVVSIYDYHWLSWQFQSVFLGSWFGMYYPLVNAYIAMEKHHFLAG